MARILVAEDDDRQARVLAGYLERDGHSVVVVRDGRAAIDEARTRRPDLVVLDVMMPNVDGLDVCRVLRADSDVPIIMVTARSTENDVLLGLDLGADDYVTKPYSPRELMARIRTLLRRAGKNSTAAEEVVTVGDLVIDMGRREVRRGGEPIDLTPREFGLLAAMAAKPGRSFTRRQLLDDAVGFDHYALERTVDMHLLNLRRKLEEDPAAPRYVLTVKGHGYKLAEN
jgi:DNA-binding response OmpR family regulator